MTTLRRKEDIASDILKVVDLLELVKERGGWSAVGKISRSVCFKGVSPGGFVEREKRDQDSEQLEECDREHGYK